MSGISFSSNEILKRCEVHPPARPGPEEAYVIGDSEREIIIHYAFLRNLSLDYFFMSDAQFVAGFEADHLRRECL